MEYMTGQTRMLFVGIKGWKDQVTRYRYFSRLAAMPSPSWLLWQAEL